MLSFYWGGSHFTSYSSYRKNTARRSHASLVVSSLWENYHLVRQLVRALLLKKGGEGLAPLLVEEGLGVVIYMLEYLDANSLDNNWSSCRECFGVPNFKQEKGRKKR